VNKTGLSPSGNGATNGTVNGRSTSCSDRCREKTITTHSRSVRDSPVDWSDGARANHLRGEGAMKAARQSAVAIHRSVLCTVAD
jgi:hypothetical protein